MTDKIEQLQAKITATQNDTERATLLNQLAHLHITQADKADSQAAHVQALKNALAAYSDALDCLTPQDDLYITLVGEKANISMQLAHASQNVRLYFQAKTLYDTLIEHAKDDSAKHLAMWHQLEALEHIAGIAGTVDAWQEMVAAGQALNQSNPNSSGLLHTRIAAAYFQIAELSDEKDDYLQQAHAQIDTALEDIALLEKDWSAYSLTYQVLGDIHARQDAVSSAIEAYQHALTDDLHANNPHGFANIAYNIAILSEHLREDEQAQTYYTKAADTYEQIGLTERAAHVRAEADNSNQSFFGRFFGRFFGSN